MNIEELSRYFVECMQKRTHIMTSRALSTLRRNDGYFNPFAGKEQRAPGQETLHNKLKDSGLLDDQDFCRAFGTWVHCQAYSILMDFMTLHDGSWGIDHDNDFKFHSVQMGKLVDFLHSMTLRDIDDPVL